MSEPRPLDPDEALAALAAVRRDLDEHPHAPTLDNLTPPPAPADLASTVAPETVPDRITGTSLRTLGRLLDAGELPGATRLDGAWRIPLADLLAAGLTPNAPSAPDPAPNAAHGSTPMTPATWPVMADDGYLDELARLRDELTDWRRRAEVAEAVAAERSAALVDVREALALTRTMLNAGPQPTPAPAPPDAPRRRRWGRKDRTA